MNIAYSQVDVQYRAAVETAASPHLKKLDRLLKHYPPDASHLHGSLDKIPRNGEFTFSLDLKIPTGALHASGQGADIRSSLNAAFKEIETQFKKHQQKLRKDYVWKRKRVRALKPGEIASAD